MNKDMFIEISWFNELKDLIIKTYNLQVEDNYLNISEQHNNTYIVCKLENGIQGYEDEENKDAFYRLNNIIEEEYIYEWDLEYILEDMIKKDVLERGNYLISYSW